ncbi:uncharacterized protein LOC129220940 [Uloborus diversus]|uniref:uncharacterized protein LOC129220940 n=1 Tax=Uloborus diversus TaxID=327109 RepID=UPI002409D51D|nr:uncharacterized protein LOC129220940 [Uloborus diversus]
MAIDLYLIPISGPCRAILMTANHIGIDVNKKHVDLFAGEQLKPEFVKINPLHTVPTIDDNGFYLWEGRAIQTYLVNKYAPDNPIYPKDPETRAHVDRMLHFDNGTLFPAVKHFTAPQWLRGKPAEQDDSENFMKAIHFLEESLGKTTYVAANHLTLADFSVIGTLTFTEVVNFDFSGYPRITQWMQKLKKEIPNYYEINDVPIQQFKKERAPSRRKKFIQISFHAFTSIAMAIDLYQVPLSAPCRSVMMTANHLGVKLNLKYTDLFAKEQLKPEFLKMNPQHTVPTIDDNGFYLWESRAILAYLVNQYSPGNAIYPKDPQERAKIDRMLYFDMGTLYKAELDYMIPPLLRGEPADPEKLEAFKKALSLFEEFLGKTTYAATNYITIADFSLVASLSFAAIMNISLSEYPRITAWMQKLEKEIPNYHEINIAPIEKFMEEKKKKT